VPERVEKDFGSFEEKCRHRAELVKLATGEKKIREKVDDCVRCLNVLFKKENNHKDEEKEILKIIKNDLFKLMQNELHKKWYKLNIN
jgi:hypothetical protein